MNTNGKNFGEQVKKYRVKRNLTKEELTKKTGLGSRTIEYIEKGRLNNPRLKTIMVIAKELDVKVEKLIGEE